MTTTQPDVSMPAAKECTFTTFDGTPLFYRAWLPVTPTDKAIILLHRGHEHSGRFDSLVRALGLDDVAAFAWDARGHGKSPGDRGYAPSVSTFVHDLDWFIRHIRNEHQIPVQNMILMAHSVGAVIAAAYVHDYAPPLRAMVLASPALRVRLYIPLAVPALRVQLALRPRSNVTSYVKAKMLTHDPQQANAYDADPLITHNIPVNVLIDLHDTATRLMADAGAINLPTLLLTAGSDWVVKNSAIHTFYQRLSSTNKQIEHYPGFHHDIYHELDRQKPIDRTRRFIQESFAEEQKTPSLLQADKSGYTKSEYDALCQPLSMLSPKRFTFAMQRLFLKSFGKISEGISTGWRTGFDSGQSLDCVYRNHPKGITPIGKLTDRIYLNAIGWRGIRIRKINLENLLTDTIRKVASKGVSPVNILDIAAGPGRYLLDTLKQLPDVPVRALLRDRSTGALEEGRALAKSMGLKNVTYTTGDAFDPQSLAQVTPQPNIVIVSGLYELFADNSMVGKSLLGISSALQPGGYLVYTNQPWHPQVEMIARVLINRDQKPWIMRRRTQAEMDELVRSAGFEKLDMLIDPYGIFTVSLARKRGAL